MFAMVGAAAIALTVAGYAGHVLRSLEAKTVDTRFDIRGARGAPDDVVVVQIDTKTFTALRNSGRFAQWPFPRRYEARVIERLAAAGPRAIAVDIQFTAATDTANDNALILAVTTANNVVLATTEVDPQGHTAIFGGDDVLRSIGAHPGNAVMPTDPDGVIRHVPYELNKLKSFGIVAAELAAGHRIPPPPESRPWIDFAGPPGTVRSYSFSDVMDGKVPPSAFRGKLVVIGPEATRLQDIHSTSTSGENLMSGAEIQANVADTALRGFPLKSLPRPWDYAFIVLLGLVAPLAAFRFRGWHSPAIAAVVAGLFAVAAQLAFDHGRVMLVTYPLLALVLSAIGVLVVEYVLEAFDRARTHDAFSRFVPEAVVDKVLARTQGELRLGGERVYGTAMFTDLRGFTTFSEGLTAEQTIELLNGYLSEISEAVLAHGGTLISFLGDGLMAVFGAPLPQDDHADRAVAAAREMLEVRLPKYNETLIARGFERGFKMGIGINTGEFMAGNVGSEKRLEYTAIGDPINTASRIEGMTKGTPYAMFLADSTREALVRPLDDLVYIAEMPVRGRSQMIKLWSLTSPAVQKDDWQSEGGAKVEPKGAETPDPAPAPVS
jgi:adenylate cyclase